MYSLDPWNDPHGALFHLDFLAIKAGMSEWLLDVIDHFETRRKTEYTYASRMDPSLLPGWAYARALALRIKENTNKDKVNCTPGIRVLLLICIYSFTKRARLR